MNMHNTHIRTPASNKQLSAAIIISLTIGQIGCAPNNYSFASTHSIAEMARDNQTNVIGFGYNGLPRKTYSRIYPTTYEQRDDLPKTYEVEIKTGNGLFAHRISSHIFGDSSFFGRLVFPLYIGEMPSASLGILYKDVSIQGVARASIANFGIGAGASYTPFRNLYLAIGYENRSEIRGSPNSNEIIYSGIFNKQSIEVERPTFQIDYRVSIPKTNIVTTFGGIFALSEQYDVQFSASMNFL